MEMSIKFQVISNKIHFDETLLFMFLRKETKSNTILPFQNIKRMSSFLFPC